MPDSSFETFLLIIAVIGLLFVLGEWLPKSVPTDATAVADGLNRAIELREVGDDNAALDAARKAHASALLLRGANGRLFHRHAPFVLGLCLMGVGRAREALVHLNKVELTGRSSRSRESQIEFLIGKATCLAMLDEHAEAGRYGREAVRLARQAQPRTRAEMEVRPGLLSHTQHVGIVLWRYAGILGISDAVEEALAAQQEAAALLRELPEPPTAVLCRIYSGQSVVLLSMDRAAESEASAMEAVSYGRQLSGGFTRSLGTALCQLADARLRLGKAPAALRDAEEAVAIVRDNMEDNFTGRSLLAPVLGVYALALQRVGRLDEATAAVDEADSVARSLARVEGTQYEQELANCIRVRAEIAASRGDMDSARELCDTAIADYSRLLAAHPRSFAREHAEVIELRKTIEAR